MGKSFDEAWNWCVANDVHVVQCKSELRWLYDKVKALEATAFLEIGSAWGGSWYVLSHACLDGATVVSVDEPSKAVGSMTTEELRNSAIKVKTQLLSEGYDAARVEADSHSAQAHEMVALFFGGIAGIDFLHIDGDHSYDGCREDINTFLPMMGEGGIIALHDISEKAPERIEVWKVWAELCGVDKEECILTDNGQGIGVLYV